ncbi:hypothetical protein BW247_10915 [Acidihalobacter ferrooxydans]|uniref:Uncharacterized protein n=1 Tax=Acidihalobacter ferrooxydans TaxID=1765967 RepID=A0A1P8UIB6_9GAMM|nr:hypothetical protein BW247_10915 [Acidihalobacter ferrooxydans]
MLRLSFMIDASVNHRKNGNLNFSNNTSMKVIPNEPIPRVPHIFIELSIPLVKALLRKLQLA